MNPLDKLLNCKAREKDPVIFGPWPSPAEAASLPAFSLILHILPLSSASLRSVPSHQPAIAIPAIWSQFSVSLSHQLSIYFKIPSESICSPTATPLNFLSAFIYLIP